MHNATLNQRAPHQGPTGTRSPIPAQAAAIAIHSDPQHFPSTYFEKWVRDRNNRAETQGDAHLGDLPAVCARDWLFWASSGAPGGGHTHGRAMK